MMLIFANNIIMITAILFVINMGFLHISAYHPILETKEVSKKYSNLQRIMDDSFKYSHKTTTLKPSSSSVLYKWNTTLNLTEPDVEVSMSESGQLLVAFSRCYYGQEPMFISNNSGLSWYKSGSSPCVFHVKISGNGQYIAAISPSETIPDCNIEGGYEQIYISNDFGISWTLYKGLCTDWKYTLTMSYSGQYIYLSENGGSTIYSSNDYGVSFSPINVFTNQSNFYLCDIATSASGEYLLLGVNYASIWNFTMIYVSNDYGNSWESLSKIEVGSLFIWGNKFVISNTGQYCCFLLQLMTTDNYQTAFTNFSSKVYISSDYGFSWKSTISFDVTTNDVSMSSSGKFVVVPSCVESGGIYISSDYGVTWTLDKSLSSSYSASISGDGNLLLASAYMSGLVYLGVNNDIISPLLDWSLRYSIPGSNVVVSSSTTSSSFIGAISSEMKSGQYIYLSSDSGSKWSTSSLITSSSSGWISITVSGNGINMAVSTGASCSYPYSQVYVSSSSGTNWKLSSGLPNICNGYWKVAYSGNGLIMYAIAINYPSKLYSSSNSGLTWSLLTSSITSALYTGIVVSTNGQNITAISSAILYQSTNYGKTWLKNSPSFFNCGKTLSIASSYSGSNMVVVSPCSSVFIYISSNYGKIWNLASTLPSISNPSSVSLAMSTTGQFIALSFQVDGMYTSTNYGRSWTLQATAPVTTSLAILGTDFTIVAGTTTGSIYLGSLTASD